MAKKKRIAKTATRPITETAEYAEHERDKLRAQGPAPLLKKVAAEKKRSDWDVLRELIADYSQAVVADSWKGGGDPQDYAEIECRLQLQTILLNTHIIRMIDVRDEDIPPNGKDL